MSSYFKQRMAEIDAEREAVNQAFRQSYEERVKTEAAKAKPNAPMPGYVYFLRSGNVVKIGYSSNLNERQRSLQTGNAERAFICKVVRGSQRTEREFHKRFAEYRLRGEWFDLRGRLAKYLERNIRPIALPQPEPKPEMASTAEFYL